MNVFDQISSQYMDATVSWEIIGIDLTKNIFVVLALIQLTWSAILWMLNRNNPDEVLVDFIRKMLFLSLFWQFIIHYDNWIPTIIDTLRGVGSKMSGVSVISPADIFEKGITLAGEVFKNSNGQGLLEDIFGSVLAIVVSFIIFLTFTRIAIEMVLILIGSRIILIGGIIMLGFAGNQWTQKYTERYFATAVNFGIKMLFMTLIIGLGESLSTTWVDLISNAPNGEVIKTYYSVLGAVLVYGYLAIRIPDMAASMLTGEQLSIGFQGAIGHGVQAARNTWNVSKAIITAPNKAQQHISQNLKESAQLSEKFKPIPNGFSSSSSKGESK